MRDGKLADTWAGNKYHASFCSTDDSGTSGSNEDNGIIPA